MNTPKRVFDNYMHTKVTTRKAALFEREVVVMFYEFVKWYQDLNYGHSPTGVTLQVFRKWLKKDGFILIKKKRV